MPPTKKTSIKTTPGELKIASNDPVIIALNSLVKTCHHFDNRQFSLKHVKVMGAVDLACRLLKKTDVPIETICHVVGMLPEEFSAELLDLTERKYLFEVVPAFGECTYRLGTTGASVLRGLIKGLSSDDRKVS